MGKSVNRAKMTVSGTPGTGAITLNAAATGFQTFAAAGVLNGDIVSYVIEDGSNWEIGQGTYSSTGPTLTRTTIEESSNSGSAISATSAATVFVSYTASDALNSNCRISQQITASTTYTPGPDVIQFLVCIFGATGGRGPGNAGSGGSGYTEKLYTGNIAGTYTVTIGAGGSTAPTAGGTTSFTLSGTGPQVTGGAATSSNTGGNGGVGSGGDANFTGGAGGNNNSSTAYGGAGGSAGRAGNGGNGAAASGSLGGGGGGSGGNNASGQTAGAAATAIASGVRRIPILISETFTAGANSVGTAGGTGSNGGHGTIFNTSISGRAGTAGSTSAGGSGSGIIYIVEWYR